MPTQSKLLIIDGIIDNNNSSDLLEKIDLFLMALSTGGERTLEEFKHLAKTSKMNVEKIISTPTMLSIIELKPE